MTDIEVTLISAPDQPSDALLAAVNDAAAELFDPFELTSKKWPKATATCGRRTLFRIYPGSKPYRFDPRCYSWCCYLKTHKVTCVDRKADAYAKQMERHPLFDGWGTVHHVCVKERDWPTLQKLAERRDARWVRVPVFGGMSHVFADIDLSVKTTERPALQMSAVDAGGVVLALLRGHDVSRQPSTSSNYLWAFSPARDERGDVDDKPKSFVLPGADELIIGRTWELFSRWTVAVFGFPSGPDVAFPDDRPLDVDGLRACWHQAHDEAAKEMGWATSGRHHVEEHLLTCDKHVGATPDTSPLTPPPRGRPRTPA